LHHSSAVLCLKCMRFGVFQKFHSFSLVYVSEFNGSRSSNSGGGLVVEVVLVVVPAAADEVY